MDREYDELLETVLYIDAWALGLVMGIVTGTVIFASTLWLLLKGGSVVGPHLALLSQFFPGYSVTYIGSIVGFIYGVIAGYIAGWCIGWLYIRFAQLRSR